LKPSNIKVTPEGRVKLLDFGLARALNHLPAGSRGSATITDNLTIPGAILGSAAYMPPEQVRGAAVDKRADIWSFGVILYECVTDRHPFAEETVQETLAAVLKTEPDWTALPPDTEPSIRRLLRRCLARDSRQRLRDIGDAITDIDEALAPGPPDSPVKSSDRGGRKVRARWVLLDFSPSRFSEPA
jgi:serine/threonine-protein kinase